jgi:hypothetical protein
MTRPDIRPPDAITPDWLTAVLRAGGIDAEVRSFAAAKVGTGQIGDSVRFRLDYARAPRQAPRSLVGKFPSAGEESRSAGVSLGNYAREVNFYRHLADSALIHTPRCYFAEVDPATSDFVLMMEDLSPARQGDQLAGVTLDQAALVMDEAAKLHASHWEDGAMDALPWLNGTRDAPRPIETATLLAFWPAFRDRYGARVTADAARVGEMLCASFDLFEALQGPRCLVHADFRPDNMMFGTDEGGYPVTTLDWQSVGYGHAATDVAYFLAGAITPDERREHGPALIARYRAKLAELGVGRYDRADFERDFARGGFQLFITAYFAAMAVTQTARGDDMFFQMLNGAVALILDSDALAMLV